MNCSKIQSINTRSLEILSLTASKELKLINVLMHHIHLYISLKQNYFDNWTTGIYSSTKYFTKVLICVMGFYRFSSGAVKSMISSSDTRLILNAINYMDSGMGIFFFSKVGRSANKNKHHEITCTFKENYILWFSLNLIVNPFIWQSRESWIAKLLLMIIFISIHCNQWKIKIKAVFIYSRTSHNIKRFYWILLENI